MDKTPKSLRYHIGIFGSSNSGKSSLLNTLVKEEVSLVSTKKGTTTDPVYKNFEVDGVGACTFIDTAGTMDFTQLGNLRMERTKRVLDEVDCALFILSSKEEDPIEVELKKRNIPIIYIKGHLYQEDPLKKVEVIEANPREIFAKIRLLHGQGPKDSSLLQGLIKEEDQLFLLVMPQDSSAPKGRIILPQVQVLRELLDHKKPTLCVSNTELKSSLSTLKNPPDWIITDSQVFDQVYREKPSDSKLTSFSILMARAKGDMDVFLQGTKAIDRLNESSRVLISEACSHAPKEEDIGTVKIPRLLRKKIGEKLSIDFSRGLALPPHIEEYDLVIFCGSCMFSHRQVMGRIHEAEAKNVSVSNYGLTIAHLMGILDKVSFQ